MRAEALAHDRDPDLIEITTGGEAAFAPDPVAAIREWEDEGVTRMVIPPLSFNPTKIAAVLGQFSENVISKLS